MAKPEIIDQRFRIRTLIEEYRRRQPNHPASLMDPETATAEDLIPYGSEAYLKDVFRCAGCDEEVAWLVGVGGDRDDDSSFLCVNCLREALALATEYDPSLRKPIPAWHPKEGTFRNW